MGRSASRSGARAAGFSRAARSLPRVAYGALRHGLLPAAPHAARTLWHEGRRQLHWKVVGDGLVRFLRNAGPLFTKGGQILATRSDLLPAPVCARLESLYAEQPAMPPAELERVLARAFGASPPFRRFESRPIAVGSVGQVHRARLASGERAIVKLLRPGVQGQLAHDLELARALLDLWLETPWGPPPSSHALLVRALDDLAEGCEREVDLAQEARTLLEFGQRFAGSATVCVPRCFESLSSGDALVMEELRGVPLSRYRRRAKRDPEAARRIASLALEEILRQIFEDGRFHADPHAGNLLVLEDGRLGLVDLGLTGELGRDDRRHIARAVKAFVARDAEGLIRALLGFGSLPPEFDEPAFTAEVRALVRDRAPQLAARLRGRDGGDDPASLEDFVTALFGVAERHGIHVRSSTTLLIKALVTIEGVARSLDPELDLAAAAAPVVLRSLAPRWLQRWMGARA